MDIKKTKNYVIGIGLVILILLGVLNACSTGPIEHEVVNNGNRFQIIYTQGGMDGGFADIIIDKETSVKYLFVKEGYGAGLTKLEE